MFFVEKFLDNKSQLSLYLCVYVSVVIITSRAPIQSRGALESQCRSGLLLSYPTIYNITSIILLLILISTLTTTQYTNNNNNNNNNNNINDIIAGTEHLAREIISFSNAGNSNNSSNKNSNSIGGSKATTATATAIVTTDYFLIDELAAMLVSDERKAFRKRYMRWCDRLIAVNT